jgi:hypothetical protein
MAVYLMGAGASGEAPAQQTALAPRALIDKWLISQWLWLRQPYSQDCQPATWRFVAGHGFLCYGNVTTYECADNFAGNILWLFRPFGFLADFGGETECYGRVRLSPEFEHRVRDMACDNVFG